MTEGFRPWREAWTDSLYGEGGFYRRPEGPAGHFETSANAPGGLVPVLAGALARLAERHGCTRIVDLGAGRGELLGALTAHALELTGVDVVARPHTLPEPVAWLVAPGGARLHADLHDLRDTLVLAHEWLDVVPCDVLEVDPSGQARLVEVDRAGTERLGAPATRDQLAWCERWWPLAEARPGDRVEVGRARDDAWRDLVGRVRTGLVVAVDYGLSGPDRPSGGTLAGHRAGQLTRPVPDGSVDLTAHVCWDSLAAAVPPGVPLRPPDRPELASGVRTQREVLAGLGVDARRPPLSDAGGAGAQSYLRRLAEASAAATLLDPAGLGGLGWLLRARVEP